MVKNYGIVCFISFLVCQLSYTKGVAQNVSSPYSILGIGDIETKDFGRYFATASTAIAKRDASTYNFLNPASLTSLPFKTMHFDIASRGKSSKFSLPNSDTFTLASKDFSIRKINIAFKVTEKAGFAFGLKPYSTSNYLYLSDSKISDGNLAYNKFVEGSGGINQVYFSYGRSIKKRISIGITAAYLFGSLIKETQYFGPSIALFINKKETDFYKGGYLQTGIQYYTPPKNKWQHKIGATFTATTNLQKQQTIEYIEQNQLINTSKFSDDNFKMPLTMGIGYAATFKNRFTFSSDFLYSHWPYQKVNYSKSFTDATLKISTSAEYSYKVKNRNGLAFEKYYVGMGFSIENGYIQLQNQPIWDYAFSFGGGYHLFRGTSLYSGIEVGNRGSKSYNQIAERYTQFVMGITIKDIWLGPKYTNRFN